MQTAGIIIRPMELNDMDDAMQLSMAEGWNQTEKDWKLFIENPGNCCRAAECDHTVVGTTTSIDYENKICWIGMVLVNKAYRGQGISQTLLAHVFRNVQHGASIKLDATPAGQQVYRKFDFKDEYQVDRMMNPSIMHVPAEDSDAIVEPVRENHIADIIAWDQRTFGANRSLLIHYLLQGHPGKAWLIKRKGRIAGFVLGRTGSRYHHVGPLVAARTDDAKLLIQSALATLASQPVVVDVLLDKEELIGWLHSIGFVKQRHFIRMYKGENAGAGNTAHQYLIAGPEFG